VSLNYRDLPIRQKLLVLGLANSACAIIAMSVAWLTVSHVLARNMLQTNLGVEAEVVADSLAEPMTIRDHSTATAQLDSLSHNVTVDEACAYDGAGVVFAEFVRIGLAATCPPVPPPDQLSSTSQFFVVTRGITVHGAPLGVLWVRGNYRRLMNLLRLQAFSAVGGLVVGLLVALAIAARLRGSIATPLQALATTSTRIARMGDYSVRATRSGNNELGALADAFNAMVAGIERRDDQLRTGSRIKDEFLQTLSHELRTPLTAVSGWLQILRRQPADPALLDRALSSMERNTRAQVRLIEDMLDVSRIITGKLQLKSDVVDLVTAIEAALDVISPTAASKGVRMIRALPPGPRFVTGDADRLQQVMWNLLSNAVKFTPPGGEVRVAVAEEGGEFIVRVRDTGAGIAADFLPHIFDRFRQANGSTSRHHGGLGLGLAIVQDLVMMHGGHVEAASDGPGRGALFTVVLPRRESTAPSAPTRTVHARTADLDGLIVLAVDDNLESLDVAGEALSRAGARVELADNASRALSALSLRRFDVLVCDLAMPEIDGFELLRRIRRDPPEPGRLLPAVAVSAHTAIEVQAEAQRTGFQGFVSKPYAFDALVLAVAQAAGRGT
jgi:signal transduction histidine kinase/CheY-like chemotaxis protein